MNFENFNAIKNEEGYAYAVQLSRCLLVPLGLWPTESTLYQRFIRPMMRSLCIFLMLFVFIPLCLFVLFIVKEAKVYVKMVGPVSFGLMTMFKYVVMIIRQHDIAFCFLSVANDWKNLCCSSDREIMLSNAKTSRWLTIICLSFMIFGGMPYMTILPLTKGPVVRANVSLMPLAHPSYFIFFNPQVKPIWNYVFVMQVLGGMVRYTVTCGINSIAILCIMHICSQISITSSMLDRLLDKFDNIVIGQIISQHLRFLKFVSKLEDLFNKIFLVEVLVNTCLICFLGYNLIMEYEQRETLATVTFFLLLCSILFNIFILCYIGEILTEQCDSIGTSAYMIQWYHLSVKEARNVLLIIASTQRPVALTAGKMIKLSLQSFTNVIKAAASYLNLLRTVVANTS